MDGAIQFKSLIPRLKELGMDSYAVTDHGWAGGLLEFQKACQKEGIKSLLGCESYISGDPDYTEKKTRDNYHLVIIAKNNKGLHKLFKLQSEAATRNFYYKPRIYFNKLQELAGDCVITTACLAGILSRCMRFNRNDYGVVESIDLVSKADSKDEENSIGINDLIKTLKSWFGSDLYLEVQGWNNEENIQLLYDKTVIELAKKHDIKTVITSDCHYLTKEDHAIHEVLMAIQFKQTLEEYRSAGKMQYENEFYVKSPEEMLALATNLGVPEAASNTQEIVEKCNAEIETGKFYMPSFNHKTQPDYKDFKLWSQINANKL